VAAILRSEIYWADLNPVWGREQPCLRPVLVLSQDIFNRRSETVIAIAITSQPQRAGFPLTLALPDGTLPKPSWVKIGWGKESDPWAPEDLNQVVSGLVELVG